jgi:hypothetical protein
LCLTFAGYGFVKMSVKAEAAKAIEGLHEKHTLPVSCQVLSKPSASWGSVPAMCWISFVWMPVVQVSVVELPAAPPHVDPCFQHGDPMNLSCDWLKDASALNPSLLFAGPEEADGGQVG